MENNELIMKIRDAAYDIISEIDSKTYDIEFYYKRLSKLYYAWIDLC